MSKPKNIKNQILQLSSEGKSYSQISSILQCSKSSISYHLGVGQKEKTLKRQTTRRNHPFIYKMDRFKLAKPSVNKYRILKYKNQKILFMKIHFFSKAGGIVSNVFTLNDVISKFGENPKCYLTGEDIDINQPRSYHFDHIIPTSKGGDNSLENLGICTRQANLAKSDMTPDEFLALCYRVINTLKTKNVVN